MRWIKITPNGWFPHFSQHSLGAGKSPLTTRAREATSPEPRPAESWGSGTRRMWSLSWVKTRHNSAMSMDCFKWKSTKPCVFLDFKLSRVFCRSSIHSMLGIISQAWDKYTKYTHMTVGCHHKPNNRLHRLVHSNTSNYYIYIHYIDLNSTGT